MSRILLVEDDEIMRISVYDRLRKEGWQVDEAADGRQALKMFDHNEYRLVISDIRMPGLDGLSLLREIRPKNPDCDVIIMTAYGSMESAIDCMRDGANDYILKPFDTDDLVLRVKRLLAAQEVRTRCEVLEESCRSQHDRKLFGQSEQMQRVYSLIDQAAPTDATILITGESGTGKELAARTIHRRSPRKNKPFISINCAAIPDGLMESEMFGHEKGAFTGADRRRRGKFELADGGTLLLDELGDLPSPLQAKLLRVLQENQFERVGGRSSIQVDVRILACTSKDLKKEVDEGRFRQDLLYRLQVIPLKMPALRDHLSDVPELCQVFLEEFRQQHGRSISISQEALDLLMQYDFPGNARELRNIMERAFVLCRSRKITPNDLPEEIAGEKRTGGCGTDGLDLNLANCLARTEKKCVVQALNICDGNRTRAAELLGISRKNLWQKMKLYDLL